MQRGFEIQNVAGSDLPNHLVVDMSVPVPQYVSDIANGAPGNLGVLVDEVDWQVSARFRNDFDAAFDSATLSYGLRSFVIRQIQTLDDVSDDLNGVEHILDTDSNGSECHSKYFHAGALDSCS